MSLDRLQVNGTPVFSLTDKNQNLFFTDNTRNASNSVKDRFNLEKKEHHEDSLLPDDPMSRFKAEVKQTSKLPGYAVNGLKGDQNANFYEFNKLASIPYWVGGPALALVFMAGGKGAARTWKRKAAGIGAYYALAAAAKAIVETPVRIFKGINLSEKYNRVVYLKPDEKNRNPEPKDELHDVYESRDFTRFDLLENQGSIVAKNPELVNQRYDKIAREMDIKEDLKDSDSTVRPYIRRVIACSRAWKSALIIPFATIAASISTCKAWGTVNKGFKSNWTNCVTIQNKIPQKIKGLGIMAREHFLKPLGQSLKEVWTGGKRSGFAKHVGKIGLIASGAGIILANVNLLRITKPEKNAPLKYDASQYKPVNRQQTSAATFVSNKHAGFNDFNNNLEKVELYNPKKNEYIL